MRENIRAYIENLFSRAPQTRKIMELKEELLSNVTAKFDDLIAQGRTEEEAYKIAVGGIGDIDELIKSFENDKIYNYARQEYDSRKSAVLVSAAVGLYIISVAMVVLGGIISDKGAEIGTVLMFIIAGIATALLVYNAMSRPKYRKADDTIVEEFKEWKSTSNYQHQLYRSANAAMWAIIVALYFILSFTFMSWAYSWVIFLIGVALHNVIKLAFEVRKR